MEMKDETRPSDTEILDAVKKAQDLYAKLGVATEEYNKADREYMAAQSRVIELLRGSESPNLNYAKAQTLARGNAGPIATRSLGGLS
jgi:hypothetical protein